MAKYAGKIGFVIVSESPADSGIWVEQPIERTYCGDLIRNTRRMKQSQSLNDNITISNQISIVADPFAKENFHSIRYAEYLGTKWKVTSVEVQYPRLVLELGEVYNGEQT